MSVHVKFILSSDIFNFAINKNKEIIGDLHNASLLIDDIEDNSKLRRGKPVAHSIFGVAPVINCANYVYFLALSKCQNLNNPEATKVCMNKQIILFSLRGLVILICGKEVGN